jgi:hypothetical protein
VVGCGSKNGYQRDVCIRENWTARSTTANDSRFNNQHDKGEPTWPLNEHENLHFDIEQDIHMSSKIMKRMTTDMTYICYSSRINCMFPYPMRSGCRETKYPNDTPPTLFEFNNIGVFDHNRSKSMCFHVRSITCCDLSGFLYQFKVYSIDFILRWCIIFLECQTSTIYFVKLNRFDP